MRVSIEPSRAAVTASSRSNARGLDPRSACALTLGGVVRFAGPVPGTLTLTVSPSPTVANGVVTADGWALAFDRVLVAIGKAGLGEGCAIYGEADYDRILDVTKQSGQKLGILFGVGKCDVDFRIEEGLEASEVSRSKRRALNRCMVA